MLVEGVIELEEEFLTFKQQSTQEFSWGNTKQPLLPADFFSPSLSFESWNGRAINTLSHHWRFRSNRVGSHVEPTFLFINYIGNKPKILIYQEVLSYLLTCLSSRRHSNSFQSVQIIFSHDSGLYLGNTILLTQEIVKIFIRIWKTVSWAAWIAQAHHSSFAGMSFSTFLKCFFAVLGRWINIGSPTIFSSLYLTDWQTERSLGERKCWPEYCRAWGRHRILASLCDTLVHLG